MAVRGERAAPVASSTPLAREITKFATVGGAGTAVNFLVFNLLRHATSFPVVRASVIATAVSIGFNYIGLRYFAYRSRDKSRCPREMGLFLLFSLVGLVIENGVLFLATYGFGWDSPLQSNLFKFIGIGVATLFRFWSYRSWVFRVIAEPRAAAGGSPQETSRTPLSSPCSTALRLLLSAAGPAARTTVARAADPLVRDRGCHVRADR